MLAADFLEKFNKHILYSELSSENITVESGIRFFFPVPRKRGDFVFLGTDAEWRRLTGDEALIPGASYLISSDRDSHNLLPESFKGKVNLIILDLPVGEIIARCNLEEDARNDPFKERQLSAFFRTAALHPLSRESAQDWVENFRYPLHLYIACIVIRPEKALKKSSEILRLTRELRDFFQETNLYWNKQEWVILWSQEKEGNDTIDLSYENFSLFLQERRLNAGISYVGTLPGFYYTHYLTASSSLDLAVTMGIPPRVKRIYSFSQFHPLYLVHLCERSYSAIHPETPFYYMAHPDIVRIFLYDQEHGTDLLDTLYTYLLNDSSLQKTAAVMFMHRNTVYNKLTKIEHVLGYHISDIQSNSIFMSYMVIKYYIAYMNRELN